MTKEAIMVNHNTFGSFGNLNEQTYSYNQEGDLDKNFKVDDINRNLIKNEEGFTELMANFRKKCVVTLRFQNETFRKFLAEVFGTFIFLSFSLASVAQFLFRGKEEYLACNLSFGIGLTLAILAVGQVSGGHMNPAVSFSMLLLGRLSPCKFMIYSLAQLIGSFLASFSVYLVYHNALSKYPKGMYSIDTAGIFGTYPNDLNDETNTFSMFFEQFFATALFLIAILAITDKKNYEIPHPMVALLIGMSLTGIGAAFGYNSGFAVNPARDFGPRFFTLMFGWGGKTFSAGNFFFWIPVLGPMMGAMFGTCLYHVFVNIHLPDDYYQ